MEEELEKILSIIRTPKSRVLNLSELLIQRDLEIGALLSIAMEIRLKGKRFDAVIIEDVNLAAFVDVAFTHLVNIVTLCMPSTLSLNNINMENLSRRNISLLVDEIISLGIKKFDISRNELYGFDERNFAELCKILKETRGLSYVYITCSNFMHTTEENQIEFWNSITMSPSIEEIYIWQDDQRNFSIEVRSSILDAIKNNFRIKFIGLYPFQNDEGFMQIVSRYICRNNMLEEWVSKSIASGDFLSSSPIVDTAEHARNTVIDWAAILNFDGKKLYIWHNSLYKMFVKLAVSMPTCGNKDEILRKTQQYAINNWAITKEGKSLISRSFEMNLNSIRKALDGAIRLYSYERYTRSSDVSVVLTPRRRGPVLSFTSDT